MAEKDKQLADSIARILSSLPANKKEYLAGVADGMAVMAMAHVEGAAAISEQVRSNPAQNSA